MEVCPNCSYRNRPGLLFCDNCGASLIGDSPLNTKSFGGTRSLAGGSSENADPLVDAISTAGTDVFVQGTILRLEIEGAEPILIKPKEETVFGRRDPATGSMPDVDLTPFAGYRMGVSRKHAVIHQAENGERLELFDLGSSNGTFLNGTRLNANKPYRLRDGDEVRFGQMMMRLYFQKMPPATSSPNTGSAGSDNASNPAPNPTSGSNKPTSSS